MVLEVGRRGDMLIARVRTPLLSLSTLQLFRRVSGDVYGPDNLNLAVNVMSLEWVYDCASKDLFAILQHQTFAFELSAELVVGKTSTSSSSRRRQRGDLDLMLMPVRIVSDIVIDE